MLHVAHSQRIASWLDVSTATRCTARATIAWFLVRAAFAAAVSRPRTPGAHPSCIPSSALDTGASNSDSTASDTERE